MAETKLHIVFNACVAYFQVNFQPFEGSKGHGATSDGIMSGHDKIITADFPILGPITCEGSKVMVDPYAHPQSTAYECGQSFYVCLTWMQELFCVGLKSQSLNRHKTT